MAIVEKEVSMEKIRPNKLGKSLAALMIIVILSMLLLYFWPIIRLW